MSRLTDHRRFATATALWIVGGCAVLAALLLAAHRVGAVSGVAAGGAVALVDVLLMVRGLDRIARRGIVRAGPRAVRGALFSRFLMVAVLIGLVVCARGVSPVGVFLGFMMLPVAIVAVGASSLRQEAHAPPGGLDGAAR